MDYITTTELRTNAKKLVSTLKDGGSVSLVHRSQIVGIFKPVEKKKPVKFNAKKFREFLKSVQQDTMSYEEREKKYRQHLEEKYGKPLP